MGLIVADLTVPYMSRSGQTNQQSLSVCTHNIGTQNQLHLDTSGLFARLSTGHEDNVGEMLLILQNFKCSINLISRATHAISAK